MTVSQLRSDLQGSHGRLFALIKGLGEEQFRYVAPGETWAVATHLAHLLRIERIFAARAAAALHEQEPRIASTRVQNEDEPGNAQRLAVPQMIHGLQAARRDLESVLERCDDAALQRTIVHERLGRMTVEQIMRKMADHEREHAGVIERLLAQLPPAGPVTIPLTQRA